METELDREKARMTYVKCEREREVPQSTSVDGMRARHLSYQYAQAYLRLRSVVSWPGVPGC